MGLQSIWKLLFGEPPPAIPSTRTPLPRWEEERRLWDKLRPLGEFRWRVLSCAGFFDQDQIRKRFHPEDPDSLAPSLLAYLEDIWQRYLPEATGPQFNAMAVIAAGLLTFGRLEMVDYILANLPPEKMELDHGCGWANVLAFRIAARLLPVPEPLRDYMNWFEGSPLAGEVRAWFAENRARLVWNDLDQRFVLSSDSG